MAWIEAARWEHDRSPLRCASDVTDTAWDIIEPLTPPPSNVGRLRKLDLREVWNAIQYVTPEGVQWRAMPKDFPPSSTVRRRFYKFRNEGPEARSCTHCEHARSPFVLAPHSVQTLTAGRVEARPAGGRSGLYSAKAAVAARAARRPRMPTLTGQFSLPRSSTLPASGADIAHVGARYHRPSARGRA